MPANRIFPHTPDIPPPQKGKNGLVTRQKRSDRSRTRKIRVDDCILWRSGEAVEKDVMLSDRERTLICQPTGSFIRRSSSHRKTKNGLVTKRNRTDKESSVSRHNALKLKTSTKQTESGNSRNG
ncbi:hypothetical protein L596_022136 [Steinernema carpocapsae]|uniref:Uncharacterized protein n=1 Tax=Steinernema carpocapsae TaxID=34508 RepID=A0A4U5MKV4_STECR|nr:hypothetical protein L596_022136 [Steinernema carpocapsae]